jgi:type IV pilus assembly protein PilN
MPRINLLPWREELRAERQREFGIHAGVAALLAVVTIGAAYFQVQGLIAHQENRNGFLKNEIAAVEKRIEEIRTLQELKQQLLNRTQVIEQLQQSRPDIVHLFDELVRTLPPGVFLTGVTQKANNLEIEGVADASGSVSLYMRNIEASDYLASPQLVLIENKSRGRERRNEFRLRAKLTPGGAAPAPAEGASR